MNQASQRLIRAFRKALRAAADPAKAPGMRAYMKSAMPYLGVQAPELRKIARTIFAAHPLSSFEEWRDTVLVLWRGARHREERYAAIELAGDRRYGRFRSLAALPIYEEMVVSGAWWDYADSIATRQLGELLRRYPGEMAPVLRQWAGSENIWKRRSAILAQLNFKGDTELALLYDCIRPSIDANQFFLRKGVGWALRQYARTDPQEVIRFVRQYEKRLSPLTKREALKHCGPALGAAAGRHRAAPPVQQTKHPQNARAVTIDKTAPWLVFATGIQRQEESTYEKYD